MSPSTQQYCMRDIPVIDTLRLYSLSGQGYFERKYLACHFLFISNFSKYAQFLGIPLVSFTAFSTFLEIIKSIQRILPVARTTIMVHTVAFSRAVLTWLTTTSSFFRKDADCFMQLVHGQLSESSMLHQLFYEPLAHVDTELRKGIATPIILFQEAATQQKQ